MADEALARGISPAVTYLATGRNFPAGLVAGAATGAANGVLLLVDGDDPDGSPTSLDFIEAHADDFVSLRLAGGPDAISVEVEDQIRAVVEGT